MSARIELGTWPVLPVFRYLRREGRMVDDEMLRTFNMGIGMILVVSPHSAGPVESSLRARGEACYRIGELVAGDGVTLA